MTWVFWLYAVIAAPWVVCAVLYGLRSPWYRSAVGWSTFVSWASVAAALSLTALFLAVPLSRTVEIVVSVVVLGAIGVAGYVQLVNLVRAQRRDRDHPLPVETP